MSAETLDQLRPLHLPEAIGWWPLAPGWWGLLILVILIIGLWLWWHHRQALLRTALKELDAIQNAELNNADFATRLNQLLRRVALANYPSQEVASLNGDNWLKFLDAHISKGGFLSANGQNLLLAAYAREAVLEREVLVRLTKRWIRENHRRSRS